MKKGDSVSISGSGKGVKIVAAVVLTLALYAAAAFPPPLHGQSTNLKNYKINEIYFKAEQSKTSRGNIKKSNKYKLLLDLKPGDTFNYKKNRESMENLHKTGLFSDVKIEVEKLDNNRLNLYFVVTPKYTVNSIKIKGTEKIKKHELLSAVFSLRRDDFFEQNKLEAALREIRHFLNSRGYFNPAVDYKITASGEHSLVTRPTVDILFSLKPGHLTIINKTLLTVPDNKILQQIRGYFTSQVYIPYQFQKTIEKIKKKLKKQKYYFPEIKVKETFLDKAKSKIELDVQVQPGYQYEFKFQGIGNKIGLIASIWETRVLEKWAEKESKARLLYHLKNKGYLNAEVESAIQTEDFVKYITFKVKKNERYSLGNLRFTGNKTFSDKKMKQVVKSDDLFFDKYFWLRFSSLRVDQEVLKLLYYFNGFPSADILIEPRFRENKVDINFVINEGRKFFVETVLFNGNHSFADIALRSLLETRNGRPFVQQKLNEDIERLRHFYYSRGFDDVEITPEISPGTEKTILVNIREGQSFRLGNLVIMGASDAQAKLIRKLFPLKSNDPFNRLKIEAFRSDIENSSIFNQFRIIKIKRRSDIIDVLIRAIPDKNNYFGYGFGGEWAKGEKGRFRGTLEYQQRNIFNSYSSLSGLFQLEYIEKKIGVRSVITYDTPYLFKRRLDSKLRLWTDTEQFPSYSFNRLGISESIIQGITRNAYVLASLSLYRTRLRDLRITPTEVDQTGTDQYTTALRLSYVRENRDDPFNPGSGNFFSSDLKLGLLMPRTEKHYPFIKFQWSFQKIFKLLKNGTLAFSVRNGLADGQLSITERFFAGGVNTFRGTNIDLLGPFEYAAEDPDKKIPRGGNAMLLLNLEASFPIPFLPSDDFYYAVFADVGNVFDEARHFRLNRLEKALGFGLRFKTQLGPLRLDFAWNLEKKEKENNFQVQIGIGNVL